MKNDKYIYDFVNNNEHFDTASFTSAVRECELYNSERDSYRMLSRLLDDGLISRSGRNQYSSYTGKKPYKYIGSEHINDLTDCLIARFPLVDFQIWEIYQLNEFVNHQLAHNIIFIEAEREFETDIFEFLRDKHRDILLEPNEETFFRYRTDETLVIQRLITGSPGSPGDPHKVSLEKLLVDLFSKSLTGKLVERSEYRKIYEDAFSKYLVNEKAMLRYAGRRNLRNVIIDFIEKQTDIKLVTEQSHD